MTLVQPSSRACLVRFYGLTINFIIPRTISAIGTSVVPIAEYLARRSRKGSIGNVTILTDGKVDRHDVNRAAAMLTEKNVQIEKITFYIKSTGGSIDFSVVAPFANCAAVSDLIDLDSEQSIRAQNTSLQDLLEKIESISTIDQFNQLFDLLQGSILTKMMLNDELPTVIVALKEMKKRLLSEIQAATRQVDYEDMTSEEISRLWYSNSTRTESLTVEQKVDRLMTMCKTRTQNFNQLAVSQVSLASRVAQVEQQLPEDDSGLGECPVLDDTSVICLTLFASLTPSLAGMEASHYNSAIFNPFLAYQLITAAVGRFGGYELCTRVDKCPETRERLLGFIPLQNTPKSVEVGDYHIRHWFFKGKKIGNPTLVLMVVYHFCKTKEYYQQYLPLLKEHLQYRLATQKCKVGMSGLQTDPQFVVSIGRAVRYCLETDGFLKRMTDQQFEAFKEFYPSPDHSLLERRYSMVQLMRQISALRHDKSQLEKFQLAATNRLFSNQNIQYYVDGVRANQPNPAALSILSKLTPNCTIDSCVSSLTTLSSLDPSTVQPVTNFTYDPTTEYYHQRMSDFDIHPATLWSRMKTPDGQDGLEYCRQWVGDRFLSMVREYIRLSCHQKRPATLDEYNRYMTDHYPTLPVDFHLFSQSLVEAYRRAIGDRPDQEVIQIMKANTSRQRRQLNEQRYDERASA